MRNIKATSIFLSSLLLFLFITIHKAFPAGYGITDLGALGESASFANGIDKSNTIAGYNITTTPAINLTGFYAFIYISGVINDDLVNGATIKGVKPCN